MFLLDSNIYISFYERYYPVEIFPSFWDEFTKILNTRIIIPKVVVDENYQSQWFAKEYLKTNYQKQLFDHKTCMKEWGEVLEYISESSFYNDKALWSDRGWANEHIADGWLIAIAKNKGYVIVTDEMANINLNSNYPSKNAKLPDVAKAFDVKCISRLDFFREIGLKI